MLGDGVTVSISIKFKVVDICLGPRRINHDEIMLALAW